MFPKKADWRCGMDLGPVGRIGALGATGVRRIESDVIPAVGVEGAGRMEEDSYDRRGEDRGLDQDADEVNEGEQESQDSETPQETLRKQVSFFA